MSSLSSPNYITPNNYISESFEIKQGKKGEQKYKIKRIKLKKENLDESWN